MTWGQLPLWDDRTEEVVRQPRLTKLPGDSYTVRLEISFNPTMGRAIASLEARTMAGELVSWQLFHSCLYHDDPDLFDHYTARAAKIFRDEVYDLNEPF